MSKNLDDREFNWTPKEWLLDTSNPVVKKEADNAANALNFALQLCVSRNYTAPEADMYLCKIAYRHRRTGAIAPPTQKLIMALVNHIYEGNVKRGVDEIMVYLV